MSSTYTTKQGDMWDGIAYTQLGNQMLMGELLSANPEYSDVYIFSAGTVLTIPDIEDTAVDDLPPWRRPGSE